jgi:hypothetical protein
MLLKKDFRPRAALTALHLSGVVFRRHWKPPRLKPWEGPFADPTQRLPPARDVHPLEVSVGLTGVSRQLLQQRLCLLQIARVAMFRSVRMIGCVLRVRHVRESGAQPLALPCIDKEGDNCLFAKRFGGLSPVQTLNKHEAPAVRPY